MASCSYLKDGDYYLAIRVQSRAKKDAWLGLYGERVKISIKAPPIDNKANQYLIKFLAKIFQVKQQQITIVNGKSSPDKLICIKNFSNKNNLMDR